MNELDQIDFIIKCTWQEISKMYIYRAELEGYSVASAFALLTIHPKEGISTSKMGPKMGIAATSISRTLQNLETHELITKHENPNDKRGTIIKLTAKGLEYRDRSKNTIVGFNEYLMTKISKKELLLFKELMQKITDAAEIYKFKNHEKKDQ